MINKETIEAVLKFRSDRNWEQFHNIKNLSIALSVESAELLEIFQWTNDSNIDQIKEESFCNIKDEIADLTILLTYLIKDLNIDINQVVVDKLIKNQEKYPISKSKDNFKKYTKL